MKKINKEIIGLFASYPFIITSGNPRINYEGVNNPFLRTYIEKIGELLSIKGNLNDLKIVYIGGYGKGKNCNPNDEVRAKLYLRAYNEYFEKVLGYPKDSLSLNNLTVVDYTDELESARIAIEDADFIFLGIGSDAKFKKTIDFLESNGIILNDIMKKNNTVLATICSGSVMTSKLIYGGEYDPYYYGVPKIAYPNNLTSLSCNPITMETDFLPLDQTGEKNRIFIEKFLQPDSKSRCIFASRQNSFFLTNGNRTYAYGEIYLFIDGKQLLVCSDDKKVDVTELVSQVNQYNIIKNRKEVIDNDLLSNIEEIINSLSKEEFDTKQNDTDIIDEFRNRQNDINMEINTWKTQLQNEIIALDRSSSMFLQDQTLYRKYFNLKPSIINQYNVDINNDYIMELYLKFNLIRLIKKSFTNYPLVSIGKFKEDISNILASLVSTNPQIVYYTIEVLGCLLENREIKKLLNSIKESLSIEVSKPNVYKKASKRQLSLFRRP